MVAYLLSQPGMEDVRSINPVVGETNDGYALNAIRRRPVGRSSPAALPYASPSLTPMMVDAITIWLHIFVCCPAPAWPW